MGRRHSRQQGGGSRFELSDAHRRRIVVEGDAKLLVEQAKEAGHALKASGLKAAQIRSIFATVRQIQMTWLTEQDKPQAHRQLQLLKPKIAYQAARNEGVRPLADILIPAIDDVDDDRGCFQNFVDFFEAILAYHVEAGGN